MVEPTSWVEPTEDKTLKQAMLTELDRLKSQAYFPGQSLSRITCGYNDCDDDDSTSDPDFVLVKLHDDELFAGKAPWSRTNTKEMSYGQKFNDTLIHEILMDEHAKNQKMSEQDELDLLTEEFLSTSASKRFQGLMQSSTQSGFHLDLFPEGSKLDSPLVSPSIDLIEP